jgi:hypothetical protein
MRLTEWGMLRLQRRQGNLRLPQKFAFKKQKEVGIYYKLQFPTYSRPAMGIALSSLWRDTKSATVVSRFSNADHSFHNARTFIYVKMKALDSSLTEATVRAGYNHEKPQTSVFFLLLTPFGGFLFPQFTNWTHDCKFICIQQNNVHTLAICVVKLETSRSQFDFPCSRKVW